MEQAKADLEKLALQVVTLEPGDIPAMGELLNAVSSLEYNAQEIDDASFPSIVGGIKGYVEQLILDQVSDVAPLEEAITLLQEMIRAVEHQEPYKGDTHHILERLGVAVDKPDTPAAPAESAADLPSAPSQPSPEVEEPPRELTEEDIQILGDFVVESMENLETIEVNLVDLEENPGDQETINAIFRPFHTIKGVSGFLSLKNINRLSHSTENLLDSARQGDLKITDAIVDMVLASVDTLKQMVTNVENALAAGDPNLEGDIDVGPIIERVENAQQTGLEENVPLGERLMTAPDPLFEIVPRMEAALVKGGR